MYKKINFAKYFIIIYCTSDLSHKTSYQLYFLMFLFWINLIKFVEVYSSTGENINSTVISELEKLVTTLIIAVDRVILRRPT